MSEKKESFKTGDGEEAVHAQEDQWLEPDVNPFLHGCCDCGLFHVVLLRIVDNNGKTVNMDNLRVQMQWSREPIETERLRSFMAANKDK